jgi:ubiquinone/menaquinone biosynthesis C-methylase UbiE
MDMNERTFDAKNALRLDDPERLKFLPPDKILSALNLQQGMSVADIGAGTGYFALPIARGVGRGGRVFAVDFQQGMLDHLRQKLGREESPKNVDVVLGDALKTTLSPQSVDMVFIGNVWHELDDYAGLLAEVERILRPSGQITILDWRTDVSQPPGPPLGHRISAADVKETLQRAGWTVEKADNVGMYSYLVKAARRV